MESMSPLVFFGTVLMAVIIGNGLCVWFVLAMIKMEKHEKRGLHPDEAHWLVLLGLICAPGALGLGAWAFLSWPS